MREQAPADRDCVGRRVVGSSQRGNGLVDLSGDRLNVEFVEVVGGEREKNSDRLIPRSCARRDARSYVSSGTEIAVFISLEYNRV